MDQEKQEVQMLQENYSNKLNEELSIVGELGKNNKGITRERK